VLRGLWSGFGGLTGVRDWHLVFPRSCLVRCERPLRTVGPEPAIEQFPALMIGLGRGHRASGTDLELLGG
jgi:hypothetical protein